MLKSLDFCMYIVQYTLFNIHKRLLSKFFMLTIRVGNSLINFWAICSFFVHEKEQIPLSLFCHERPERIAHGCTFVKSNGSESHLGIKRGKGVKNKNEKYKFVSQSLYFCEWFAQIPSESLTLLFLKSNTSDLIALLFCKEQCKWIAHGRSFAKSDVSQSLMVAL